MQLLPLLVLEEAGTAYVHEPKVGQLLELARREELQEVQEFVAQAARLLLKVDALVSVLAVAVADLSADHDYAVRIRDDLPPRGTASAALPTRMVGGSVRRGEARGTRACPSLGLKEFTPMC